MGNKVSGLMSSLYDSKKKQFLGRDGAAWGKLGIFYFFFYLGLAGFFCAMLAVFMALSPRDRPRYYAESSRMRTRSNPLSPGLGFRPQPDVEKNVIIVDKQAAIENNDPFSRNLDQYLKVYYGEIKATNGAYETSDNGKSNTGRFIIQNPGDCTSAHQYGFKAGQPCILVKMNKIYGFEPIPKKAQKRDNETACSIQANAISIKCSGEYPADVDNIGEIKYFSELGQSKDCGTLATKWFPYTGKSNRQDVYQAPYFWVQFLKPKPNVLINVICRAYAENIDFDKKTGRGLTRFQIFVDGRGNSVSSKKSGDM